LTPAEAAVHAHATAAAHVRRDVLSARAEDRHVEEVGTLAPLAIGFLVARVVGDPQVADRRSGRYRAQLGVAREAADEDHAVDVVHRIRLLARGWSDPHPGPRYGQGATVRAISPRGASSIGSRG